MGLLGMRAYLKLQNNRPCFNTKPSFFRGNSRLSLHFQFENKLKTKLAFMLQFATPWQVPDRLGCRRPGWVRRWRCRHVTGPWARHGGPQVLGALEAEWVRALGKRRAPRTRERRPFEVRAVPDKLGAVGVGAPGAAALRLLRGARAPRPWRAMGRAAALGAAADVVHHERRCGDGAGASRTTSNASPRLRPLAGGGTTKAQQQQRQRS